MPKVKVLVTGGAGFIGSHLCEALLAQGYAVVCLDNFDNYYPVSVKKKNITPPLKNKNFTLIRGDIRNAQTINKLFSQLKFNLLVHLAARAGVRPSIEKPLLYEDVNIRGTLVLLEACRKYGVKKVIFASSSSVYGQTRTRSFRETDAADRPLSPYGASKRAGELMCHSYHHLFGLSIACLRFFTVYGPRQRPDLAIYKFTDLMMRHQPIFVFGDGSSQRDYTYIDDIIIGIENTIKMLWQAKKPIFEIINLGTSNPISLRKLIKLLECQTGKKAKIIELSRQLGDMPNTFASCDKSSALLGFRPKTRIQNGLKHFFDWYTENK